MEHLPGMWNALGSFPGGEGRVEGFFPVSFQLPQTELSLSSYI